MGEPSLLTPAVGAQAPATDRPPARRANRRRAALGADQPAPAPRPSAGPVSAAPADAEDVQNAIRLGWHVAELRGLYDPAVVHEPDPATRFPDFALRLSTEWPRAGRADGVEQVVEAMAAALQVDIPLQELDLDPAVLARLLEAPAPLPLTPDSPASTALATLLARLHDGDRLISSADAWQDFARFLRQWDEQLQTRLSARSPRLADGYRLARAFAEIRWALHPDAPDDDASSWAYLAGPARRAQLLRLVDRLAPYLHPLAPICFEASLQTWGQIAADPEWRRGAQPWLAEQTAIWHDVLLDERSPATLMPSDPILLLRQPHRLLPILGQFRFEVLLTVLSVTVVMAATWLGNSSGASASRAVADAGSVGGVKAVSWVLGILGAFGVTVAGVTAHVRANVHGLFDRLRTAFAANVLRDASAVLAPLPWPPARESRLLRMAGTRSRAAAMALDCVIVYVASLVLLALFILAAYLLSGTAPRPAEGWAVLLVLVVGAGYFHVTWAAWDQTPGMAAFNLVLVQAADGRRLAERGRLVRTAFSVILLGLLYALFYYVTIAALLPVAAFCAVTLASIAVARDRRGWHDRLAGSAVVWTELERFQWSEGRRPGSLS